MSFEQDGIGVTAVLQGRRTGTEHMLQRLTTYLIADGANSSIRRRLGIGDAVTSRLGRERLLRRYWP